MKIKWDIQRKEGIIMLKIESNEAIIQFETKGAQMISFKKKDYDFEYLWQPKEGFWQGRNPILFPLVGSTADKILHIDGKEYVTGNHGFARHSQFEVVGQKEDEITFKLSENEETLKQYPFHFDLEVTYKLVGTEVLISYRIFNKSDKMMPFTFGLHPAFSCPFQADETIKDTWLEFSNEETQACEGLIFNRVKRIDLSEELFQKAPTLIFEHCASSSVSMTDGKHGVKVTCPGYRYLAFWKQPNAEFVCIEPWHGGGVEEKEPQEFKDRNGMIHLQPQKTYTTEYKISVF